MSSILTNSQVRTTPRNLLQMLLRGAVAAPRGVAAPATTVEAVVGLVAIAGSLVPSLLVVATTTTMSSVLLRLLTPLEDRLGPSAKSAGK
jgi:hypothetical protein